MRNMQTVDGGLNTPDAPAETLSEINSIPMTFSLNQSSAMVLPVVSDSQKLIWVHLNQMEQHLEAAAELVKQFDRFPYLTQKQTASLAERCSLHPDQVKVWFMEQRLRFGISWDYKDIRVVRKQLKSNQEKTTTMGKEEKSDSGEKKTQKTEVKKSGRNKARGKLRKEQSKVEEGMVGVNVTAYEQMEEDTKLEPQMKKEMDGEVKDAQRKRKKRKKMGEEKIKQGNLDEWLRCWPFNRNDKPSLAVSQSEPWKRADPDPFSFPSAHNTLDKTKVWAKLEEELQEKSTNLCDTVTDVDKLRALIDADDNPTADQHAEEKSKLPTKIRCFSKTQTQVEMMRKAFLHCQYPDSEEYEHLSMLINVPRYLLVQWYGDTRYHIKRGRPRWMSEEHHCRTLANVEYRQYLKKLQKLQQLEKGQKIRQKNELGSVTCGEETSELVPTDHRDPRV